MVEEDKLTNSNNSNDDTSDSDKGEEKSINKNTEKSEKQITYNDNEKSIIQEAREEREKLEKVRDEVKAEREKMEKILAENQFKGKGKIMKEPEKASDKDYAESVMRGEHRK